MSLAFLLLSLLPALAVVAALFDVGTMTIPNRLTGALALAFVPAALAVGLPWPVAGMHLLVGLGALAFGAGLFAMGWLGGGDAKLLAASALWLGWPASLTLIMWTAIGGGVLAMALLAARKTAVLAPAAARGPAWLGKLLTPGGDVPYGVAIALGVLIAFPACDLVGRV